ncbi:hypothetical protein HWV62_5465 [Athelia sp. TMB]|nr:hypothetical protein HWV62_5465 [Athelia sp. TMB]
MAYACKERSDEIIAQTWAAVDAAEGADIDMDASEGADDTATSATTISDIDTKNCILTPGQIEKALRHELRLSFSSAGGTLGSKMPWNRLLANMGANRLISRGAWPWSVFTPVQTGASGKGLACLRTPCQLELLQALRGTKKFFVQIDEATWKAYYETNERPMITTTVCPDTNKPTTVFLSGRFVDGTLPAKSSSSSTLAALQSNPLAITRSRSPTSIAEKTRAKGPTKAVVDKGKQEAEKEKSAKSKGKGKAKQKPVDDDVLEISSDDHPPAKVVVQHTPTPSYISSGSDSDGGPAIASDLKRKAADAAPSRSVRTRESQVPSTAQEKLASVRPSRTRPPPISRTPGINLARPQATPSTTVTTRGLSPSPSPAPRAQGRAKAKSDLAIYARPNPMFGSSAVSSASPSTTSRALSPNPFLLDGASHQQERRSPAPLDNSRAKVTPDIASPVTSAAPAPVAAASAPQMEPAVIQREQAPPHHTVGLQRAASYQGDMPPPLGHAPLPQSNEAPPPQMLHAQGTQPPSAYQQTALQQPQHDYGGMHHSGNLQAHPGPPAQGYWAPANYYHPPQGYPQAPPNYAQGYNPAMQGYNPLAYQGQQQYHPHPPSQQGGPPNAMYNIPMPFAGQAYPPAHPNPPSRPPSQQAGASDGRATTPLVPSDAAMDTSFHLRRTQEGPK